VSAAPLRVHRIPYSTNVERVALAAAHKGVSIDWIDHDPADRSGIHALSGQQLVPVLEAGTHIVPDSTAILRWLEAQHPDRPLWPPDPGPRAVADIFVDWFNRVWKVAPNEIVRLRAAAEPDDGAIARHAADLRAALERFEDLLSAHPFLLGQQLGIADVIAFPFLKYPVLGVPSDDTDPFHAVLVEFMPLGDGYAELRDWVRRVDALPRA
jgi:glutathione S-transferase